MSEQTRKPKEGWRQLDFKYIMCVPTSKCAALLFGCLFIVSLILGAVLLGYSYKVVEYRKRYDDDCKDQLGQDCIVNLDFPDKLEHPVFIYYEIHNYFQNHRKYVKSYCKNQLADEDFDKAICQFCAPYAERNDYPDDNQTKELLKKLDASEYKPKDLVHPCGLIAYSLFKDVFTLKKGDAAVQINDNDISWFTDDESKFKNTDNYKRKQYRDVEDPHFKVWMRTSATSKVRKLYGKIEEDIDEGEVLKLTVLNIEDYSDFEGEKWVVFSTANAFGGKNNVLGWCLIAISILSLIWTVVFIVFIYKVKPVDCEEHFKKQ